MIEFSWSLIRCMFRCYKAIRCRYLRQGQVGHSSVWCVSEECVLCLLLSFVGEWVDLASNEGSKLCLYHSWWYGRSHWSTLEQNATICSGTPILINHELNDLELWVLSSDCISLSLSLSFCVMCMTGWRQPHDRKAIEAMECTWFLHY